MLFERTMSNLPKGDSTSNHPAGRTSTGSDEQVSEATRAVEQTAARADQPVSIDDFEELYVSERGRVFSTAYRMVGNRADAEDLTQDVFVKVFKQLHKFRGASSVSTWIYRITMNTCLDFLRKRKRRPTVSLELVGDVPADSSNLKGLIESVVSRMSEGYRTVFVLHDIQGLKHSEIAEILGITEGASKSQLHRARARLRMELTPYVKGWK